MVNNSLLANNSQIEEIEYMGNDWDSVYWPLLLECFFAACFLSLLFFSSDNEEKNVIAVLVVI